MTREEFYREIGAALLRARQEPVFVASHLTYAAASVLYGAGLSKEDVKSVILHHMAEAFRQRGSCSHDPGRWRQHTQLTEENPTHG